MTRHVLERSTLVPGSLHDVFAFFAAPENLGKITPPEMGFQIVSAPAGAIREGDRIEYRIRIAGVPLRWRTLITSWKELESFADFQEKGPYRHWHHTHTFREVEGGVEMHDRVEYELPLGWLGDLAAGWIIRRQLKKIFDYRAEVITRSFG